MTYIALTFSVALIITGSIGIPSPLNKKPNTASLVFLTGILCFIMSLISL